ncbi:hypothetical protein CEK25_004146 [Fusarium fujikuroi]|nr:hypothetical protein CEK25_004146 [Fusarium fujikuroi]
MPRDSQPPTPFRRTNDSVSLGGQTTHFPDEPAGAEFLWIQEGHTAVDEELLAVLEILGFTLVNEKLAGGCSTTVVEAERPSNGSGGYYTTTVAIPSNGRGIQGATSHALGQNFRPSTRVIHVMVLIHRVIGVMVMIHGDDKGLVEDDRSNEEQVEVRANSDWREGWCSACHLNDWELERATLRMEFNDWDAAKGVVCVSSSVPSAKGEIVSTDVATKTPVRRETIQADVATKIPESSRDHPGTVSKAENVLSAHYTKWEVFFPLCGDNKNVVLIKELSARAPKCEDREIKELTTRGRTSLCVPFEKPEAIATMGMKSLSPVFPLSADEGTMFGRRDQGVVSALSARERRQVDLACL